MSSTGFDDAAEHNVLEALRHFARHADGAVLEQTASTLLVASASVRGSAYHNAAVRLSRDVAPDLVLAEMREFGRVHGRAMVLWTAGPGDDDLGQAALAAGLEPRPTTTGMAVTVENWPSDPATAPGIAAVPATATATATGAGEFDLSWVTDEEGVAAFTHVHTHVRGRDGGGIPPELAAHFASPGALLAANVRAAVVTTAGDGRPVACAMALHSGREAGLYWVATNADVRNRGLGGRVSRAVTQAAFDLGAETVVLQATRLGEPVYRRIGFQPFTTYRQYVLPVD